jgi:hypothetical protein
MIQSSHDGEWMRVSDPAFARILRDPRFKGFALRPAGDVFDATFLPQAVPEDVLRIHTVIADPKTGEWLTEPRGTGLSTSKADWDVLEDTRSEHYDTVEIDGVTCALVVQWMAERPEGGFRGNCWPAASVSGLPASHVSRSGERREDRADDRQGHPHSPGALRPMTSNTQPQGSAEKVIALRDAAEAVFHAFYMFAIDTDLDDPEFRYRVAEEIETLDAPWAKDLADALRIRIDEHLKPKA